MGNASAACLLSLPFTPQCEAVVGVLELLVEGVNEYGYSSSVYDGETECMQGQNTP